MSKKIILVFALFIGALTSLSAQRAKLDQLFDKYQDTEGVTSIKIAKPMFSMLNSLDLGDDDFDAIRPLLSKIQGLKILVIEKNAKAKNEPGSTTKLDFDGIQGDIKTILKNLHYDELMTVNSKGNKIKFLSSAAVNGMLEDLLLSINSDDSTVLMMLDGKISMKDVNSLINESKSINTTNKTTTEPTSSVVVNRNSETRNVAKFNALQISSGIKVNFTQGENQEVRVETDEDKLKYIKTEVKNGVLNIFVAQPEKQNLNFNKIFVNIVAPNISKITTNTGANLTVLNTLKSNNLNLECASGSLINGAFGVDNSAQISVTSGANFNGDITANYINFEGTSGSSAVLNGSAQTANFLLTSAATCNAQNLSLGNVTAKATSAGILSLNVKDNLKAEADSGGKIRYKGSPQIDKKISTISGGKLVKF